MRFRNTALTEMTRRILGWVENCPICKSDREHLVVWKRPAVVSIGGFPHDKDHPAYDPESNALFYVVLECQVCSHAMFFNGEQLTGHKESVLVVGMTEEQEAEAERTGNWSPPRGER